jgi:hypothetical protein
MKKNGAWRRVRKSTVHHAWASIGCDHNTWMDTSIEEWGKCVSMIHNKQMIAKSHKG